MAWIQEYLSNNSKNSVSGTDSDPGVVPCWLETFKTFPLANLIDSGNSNAAGIQIVRMTQPGLESEPPSVWWNLFSSTVFDDLLVVGVFGFLLV